MNVNLFGDEILLDNLFLKTKLELSSVIERSAITRFYEDIPPIILFFVVSNGKERAHVIIETGNEFKEVWERGEENVRQWCKGSGNEPIWLRVEIVNYIQELTWLQLKTRLNNSKRNYFRFGISFSHDFSVSILEHELYANAILYKGDVGVATPNDVNLRSYGVRRFNKQLKWPTCDDTIIYRFKTKSVFTDGKEVYHIESDGRNSGYRRLDKWNCDIVTGIIQESCDYLAKQVKENGEYHYGWFPCFDRAIPTYNALRHASSTYALLEGWDVTQELSSMEAIKRALYYLEHTLIKKVGLPCGAIAAFLVDIGGEIKLGGNAVSILAYAKYTEVTNDYQYLVLMEELALGILYMQNTQTGEFVHVLNYPDLSLKAKYRTIYYDGEAAFGLMRLYGITKDPRWIKAVEKAFDYFIEKSHWRAHDHWLSYCVNELTLYNPNPKYYKFGLDNVRDHLDFVLTRVTTFPTLLELMMAAQSMIERIKRDSRVSYLLDGFEIDKFYYALEYRARYLLNGFFYPEIAMFFKKPQKILGGFFIRHHSFRVRIDDVEHYLSGYIAYLKYLLNEKKENTKYLDQPEKGKSFLKKDNLQKIVNGEWVSTKIDLNMSALGICVTPSIYRPGYILIARGKDNKGFLSESAVKKLVAQGALGVICEDPSPYILLNVPILKVSSVRKAVLCLGLAARESFSGFVVGVTGSAGKTTTVSMIAHALSFFGQTGSTCRSANLPIGISWNQINMPMDAKNWVIEMAIGQMPVNSELVIPQVAVITNIGPAHLEYHVNTEIIAEKKSFIMNAMQPKNSLVLFGEIKHKEIFLTKAKEKKLKIITYGEEKDNDLQLLSLIEGKIQFKVFGVYVNLRINVPNKYIALNVLSAFAVAYALGLDWTKLLDIFSSFSLPKGRGEITTVNRYGKTFIIYDDTYNANPLSMRSAMLSLKTVSQHQQFLIIGDMKELGDKEIFYHRDLKRELDKLMPKKIILCGDLMYYLWLDIKEDKMYDSVKKIWVHSVNDIIDIIGDWLEDQDYIVLKASNSMGFEKIVHTLKGS